VDGGLACLVLFLCVRNYTFGATAGFKRWRLANFRDDLFNQGFPICGLTLSDEGLDEVRNRTMLRRLPPFPPPRKI